MKVTALENVSIREEQFTIHTLEKGKKYNLPKDIALALGTSVTILEIDQKKDTKPKKNKMVDGAEVTK